MKTWSTTDGPVTEDFVNEILLMVTQGYRTSTEMTIALCRFPGDRRIDKALRLLKAAGRIRYSQHARAWSVVQDSTK